MGLNIYIQRNEKTGSGYQVHVVQDCMIDAYSMTLEEAKAQAESFIAIINNNTGENHAYSDVVNVDTRLDEIIDLFYDENQEVIDKYMEFIRLNGYKGDGWEHYELESWVYETYTRYVGESEPELFLYMYSTGIKELQTKFATWKQTSQLQAMAMVMRYCRYLTMKGYGKSADDIINDVSAMEFAESIKWLNSTLDEYAKDQNELLNYLVR